MNEEINPIIGCVLGHYNNQIAKVEFVKGCGCSNRHCVEISKQSRLYILKEKLHLCKLSYKVFKNYTWTSIHIICPITILIIIMLFTDVTFNKISYLMFITISILLIFYFILRYIHIYIIKKCILDAKTFSKIRIEFCDECIIFPTCSTACNDFCLYLYENYLDTSVEVKDIEDMDINKIFNRIKWRILNRISL